MRFLIATIGPAELGPHLGQELRFASRDPAGHEALESGS